MLEIEAKFMPVKREDIIPLLIEQGFTCIRPFTLLKRAVFHPNGSKDSDSLYARVRDEGDRITMTVKRILHTEAIDGVEEADLLINSFQEGCHLLRMLGLEQSAYQETTREVWCKDSVEVMCDEWPGLPPFIEIESHTEQDVKDTAESLGLNYQDAVFGAVNSLYEREWGINCDWLNRVPRITFDHPITRDMAQDYNSSGL